MGFQIGMGISITRGEGGGWWSRAYGSDVGLAIDFANNRTYNAGVQSTPFSLLTYTAPSNKTVTGSNGLLRVTNAAAELPIDYDPLTGACKGVLIEEARTNLLLQSQTLGTTWLASNFVSVTSDAATAPDGTVTADTIVPDNSANAHSLFQTPAVSASTAYTYSVYVKAAGYSKGGLREGVATGAYVSFDLSNGTILDSGAGTGTALSTSITSVGNGWYRVTLTITTTGVQSAFGCRIYVLDPTYTTGVITGTWTPNGTSGIYAWGAQLEAGSFQTSLVPTVASQVTRAADNLSLLTSAFGFNAAAGTMLAVARLAAVFDAVNIIWDIGDGTDNEKITANVESATVIQNFIMDGAVLQANLDPNAGTLAGATEFKNAMAWAANDIAAVLNGGAVVTDAAATLPTVTGLRIGWTGGAAYYFNGHIKSLAYWPTRKSNAYLQQVTL